MNDKNNFIPRHDSPLFYPQDPSVGFQGGSGGLSRRKFLKRTGGATAATFVSWVTANKAFAGSSDPAPNESNTQHSALFRQYKMVCEKQPAYTDGAITWSEVVWTGNTPGSGVTGNVTLKGSGPQEHETKYGKMTPVTGKILSTILQDGEGGGEYTKKFEVARVLKLGDKDADPYYGGAWIDEDDPIQPVYTTEKSPKGEEPLDNEPYVNLEVQSERVAMNFSHSGNFDGGLTSVTQGSNNNLSTKYTEDYENLHTEKTDAEADLEVNVNGETGSISKLINGGLEVDVTGGAGYKSQGSATSKETYNKVIDENDETEWVSQKTFHSTIGGLVEANWVIELYVRTKRVAYMDGVKTSEDSPTPWVKVETPYAAK